MKTCCIIALLLVALVESAIAQYRDIEWIRGGHGDVLLVHALSPDGSIVATANADRTVKFWEVGTGYLRGALHGYSARVHSLAFTPDGEMLITAADDSTLRYWDAKSYREVKRLRESSIVSDLALTPDGERMIVRLASGVLLCWDITADTTIWSTVLEVGVSKVHLSQDGSILAASGHSDTTMLLWDATTGSLLHSLSMSSQGRSVRVMASALSPDGAVLAVADRDSIRLWSTATGSVEATSSVYNDGGGPANAVTMQFFAEGDSLLMYNRGGLVEIRDGRNVSPVRTMIVEMDILSWENWPVHTTIMSDGEYLLVSGTRNGGRRMASWPVPLMEVWNLSSGQRVRTLLGHSASIAAVAFVPGRREVISCSGWNGEFKQWKEDGALASQYSLWSGDAHQMNFAPDGSAGIESLADRDLYGSSRTYVWGRGKGTIDAGMHDSPMHGWVAPYGVAACYMKPYPSIEGYSLYLWERATNTIKGPLPINGSHGKSGTVFSPDASRIATVAGDRIVVWNIADSSVEHQLDAPARAVSLAWSPDGAYIAAGCADGQIAIWSVWNEMLVQTLGGHHLTVTSLSFSRGNRFLVSASADSTVRTWSIETGVNDYIYDEYPGVHTSVSVTPDGQQIASGTEDGSIIMWKVRGAIASIANPLSDALPSQSTLRIYPTPASSLVTIECELQQQGRTLIQIVNHSGEEIARIADGAYEPGIQRFTLDARNFPSGIYHCILTISSGRTATNILILH